jgi:outer membrane scaffolding protein for murein synthesis (MipA/OmpV family)
VKFGNNKAAPLGAVFCLLLANLPAAAQEVAEIPFWHQPAGSAGLGGGFRFGQDPYLAADNDDQRNFDLVPLYLYEGKYFFARGATGGFHIVDSGGYELNVMARYRFQQLDPDRNEFYEGLEKRRQTLDAGVEFRMSKAWGELAVNWLTDTLDRHNGQQAQVTYRYRFKTGRWSISPFITWTYQDEDLTDYYFGVSAAEATIDRPEFSAGSSQWNTFGVNTAWHFSDRIVFFANVAFAGADSDVWDSPLVEESNMSQFFIGGTYTFGNARAPSDISDPLRRGEWAWRVNYGYQASGNIVSEIDQGDFSKSEFADTRIGGLTLTKLLHDGPRVDFQGRFALHRHFEDNEDNGNFFSYNAYIMAMGKGYSGWTGEEWFRWGFGFGMSYAETVPIEEQRKQESRGENTAHFINYLEMMVDFPLRRVSRAKWLQDCYAGLTIVHRSGIFGTSDLLGDVSGGSDWITAHLECVR